MTDVRRLMVGAVLSATLALAGCGGEPSASDGTPTAEPSSDGPSSEAPSGSATDEPSGEPSADGGDGPACDAIDVDAVTAETGLALRAPSSAGEVGADEGCSVFVRKSNVAVSIDLAVEHGSLEEDLDQIRILGTEEPEGVSVAGSPALVVTGEASPLYVNLVTHVGERMMTVRLLAPGEEPDRLPELEDLVLVLSEQVAAGAA